MHYNLFVNKYKNQIWNKIKQMKEKNTLKYNIGGNLNPAGFPPLFSYRISIVRFVTPPLPPPREANTSFVIWTN